jgi:5-keto-L-gluconate epimerase
LWEEGGRMKLAYVYGTSETVAPVLGARGDAHTIFPRLKDNGYVAIEPFVRDPKQIDMVAFEKNLNRYEVEVAAVGTGPVVSDDKLTFTDHKTEIRAEAVKRTKDIVDFASRFDAPINIGKLRGDIDVNQPEQSWKWMKEGFMEVCEYAEKRGINIMLEPQNNKNINNINSTIEALTFIEEMNISNFYLMLDIYHLSFEKTNISSTFTKAKNKLLHLHFADRNRVLPGQGDFDFGCVMQSLRAIQYDHYISMEVTHEKNWYEEAKSAALFLTLLK